MPRNRTSRRSSRPSRTCARASTRSGRSWTLSISAARAIADEVFRDLLNLLALNFVRLKAPRLYYILQATSFAEEFSSVYGGEFGGVMAIPRGFRRLFDFVTSPCSWFDQTNFDTEDGVRRISDRTLLAIAGLAAYRKVIPAEQVLYGWDLVPGVPGSDAPTAVDRTLARTLTLMFAGKQREGSPPASQVDTSLATLAFLPRTQGGPGVFVSLGGGYEIDAEISKPWYFSGVMQATGAVSYLISKERIFEISAPSEGSDFRAGLAFEARPDPVSNKAFDIRFAKGTGLSIGLLRFEAAISKQEATLKTIVHNGVLSVGKVFDGFLDHLIPSDGLRVDFDFGVGLGSARGVFLEGQVPSIGASGAPSTKPASLPPPGGAVVPPPLPPLPKPEATGPGISIRIPIGKSLGPLTIHDVQVRVGVEGSSDDRTYLLEGASSISTKLGPVVARVDQIGVRLGIKLPDDPSKANLGILDLDVGAKMPNGVGLAIDAKGLLTGGGFLIHDSAQQLYAGVMQLTLHEHITVKAFGLIATRLPDGSKGYSLLVFITAQDFRPIPLGVSATLQGIGGMIAHQPHVQRRRDARGTEEQHARHAVVSERPDPQRAGNHPQPGGDVPRPDRQLPVRRAGEDRLVLADARDAGPRADLRVRRAPPADRARPDQVDSAEGGQRSHPPEPRRDGRDRLRRGDREDRRGPRRFAARAQVRADRRDGLPCTLDGGPGAGFALAVGGLNPRFAPPTGMPALERDRDRAVLRRQSAPHLRGVLRDHAQHDPVRRARAALRGGIRLQRRRRRRLRRADPAGAVSLHGRLPRLDSAQARLAQSVQGVDCRCARRAAPAARERQGFVRDLLVRLLGPLRQDAGRGREATAAACRRRTRRAHARAGHAESWSTLRAANRQHGVALRALTPGPTLVLDPLGNLMVKQSVVPLNTTRDIDTFGGAPVAGARRFQITATLTAAASRAAPSRISSHRRSSSR